MKPNNKQFFQDSLSIESIFNESEKNIPTSDYTSNNDKINFENSKLNKFKQ